MWWASHHGCGDGALRERAAAVPGRDGLADMRREDAGGAADVQDLALPAEDDWDDVCVAGDFADGAGGDGAVEQQRSRAALVVDAGTAEPLDEVPIVDGGHDLRPEPACGGKTSRGEGNLAGTDEAVQQPLRPGTKVEWSRFAVLGGH